MGKSQSKDKMEGKSKKPAVNINVTFMSKGRPEAVTHDIVTDLPYENLIHNQVEIGFEKPPTQEYLMD